MNREELIRLLDNLEVVKAWVEGKTIQVRNSHDGVYLEWEDHHGTPDFGNCFWEWRIKPREFWLTGDGESGYREAWDKKPPGPHFIHVREV